jgi:hypothetical protein
MLCRPPNPENFALEKAIVIYNYILWRILQRDVRAKLPEAGRNGIDSCWWEASSLLMVLNHRPEEIPETDVPSHTNLFESGRLTAYSVK